MAASTSVQGAAAFLLANFLANAQTWMQKVHLCIIQSSARAIEQAEGACSRSWYAAWPGILPLPINTCHNTATDTLVSLLASSDAIKSVILANPKSAMHSVKTLNTPGKVPVISKIEMKRLSRHTDPHPRIPFP